jgi:hypothetical protein
MEHDVNREKVEKRQRLFVRIPPRRGRLGISPQDIARISVDPALVGELQECLRSDDDVDVTFGLYFIEHLRPRPDFCLVAEPAFEDFASLIRDCLSHPHPRVRADAIGAFVAFRDCYDGYEAVMRALLRSPDSEARCAALRAAPTFVSPRELDVLLPLRNDPLFGETEGMGGPRRYLLRDYALKVAEHIAGRKFDNGDNLEQREGLTLSWRSWAAFVRWLESGQHRRAFGRHKTANVRLVVDNPC